MQITLEVPVPATVVDSDSSDRGQVINQQQVLDLPLEVASGDNVFPQNAHDFRSNKAPRKR